MAHELALVMPVYNEEECIVDVVNSWRDTLGGLGIKFIMFVLNDGSKDSTAAELEQFAAEPSVRVINKPNSGHGPTILQGYRLAVEQADWVFQCDSDNEMRPEGFAELWHKRNGYDALFGFRMGRLQSRGRKLISACSRLTVRILFGGGVTDVNTPYRLMRSDLLSRIIEQIPADTFAPNVIISGTFARAGLRIYNTPVPHEHRRTGSVSIVKWKLWKSAFRSFGQTVSCRPEISSAPTPRSEKKPHETAVN